MELGRSVKHETPMRLVIASTPYFHLASLCAWPFDRSTRAVNSMVGQTEAIGGEGVHELRVGEEPRVLDRAKWKRGEDKKKEKGRETLWKWKFHLVGRRSRPAVCVARERRFPRRREISLARFSARKCFPHSRREIFGAGHFVLRSWSTKGSRDGFANSFHTRPSPIHRGIASKGLVCLVWISRLGEDFDRFRWWDTSGLSIRGIGRFVLVLREKTRCKMVLNMREFFKFSCFITPNFHKPF